MYLYQNIIYSTIVIIKYNIIYYIINLASLQYVFRDNYILNYILVSIFYLNHNTNSICLNFSKT